MWEYLKAKTKTKLQIAYNTIDSCHIILFREIDKEKVKVSACFLQKDLFHLKIKMETWGFQTHDYKGSTVLRWWQKEDFMHCTQLSRSLLAASAPLQTILDILFLRDSSMFIVSLSQLELACFLQSNTIQSTRIVLSCHGWSSGVPGEAPHSLPFCFLSC